MRQVDALVIGAGPAGATAALALARGGMSVTVVEKTAFPRRKVCGEFVSATTWPVLEELGAGDLAQRAGPPVDEVGLFAGDHVVSAPMPGRTPGRAVRRDILDTALLDLAGAAGAQVRQPAAVSGYARNAKGFAVFLTGRDDGEETIAARFIVAAHGSWERAPASPDARPARRDADLLGFKAHFAGARLAAGLMPLVLFPGGYGGMVHVDGDRASFSCCVRRDMLHRIRGGDEARNAGAALLAHVMRSCRGVREALAHASQDSPWLSAGPIRPGIRSLHRDGVFFVGNAAGEAHPLVAEGISMAIQSSQLLAGKLLGPGTLDDASLEEAGHRYALEWRANFSARLRASSAFAALLVTPVTRRAGIGVIASVPATLTLGARWSGKARMLARQEIRHEHP